MRGLIIPKTCLVSCGLSGVFGILAPSAAFGLVGLLLCPIVDPLRFGLRMIFRHPSWWSIFLPPVEAFVPARTEGRRIVLFLFCNVECPSIVHTFLLFCNVECFGPSRRCEYVCQLRTGGADFALLCSCADGNYCGALRMPFRAAVIEQTTTVQVGYMSKPQAVTVVTHDEGG